MKKREVRAGPEKARDRAEDAPDVGATSVAMVYGGGVSYERGTPVGQDGPASG